MISDTLDAEFEFTQNEGEKKSKAFNYQFDAFIKKANCFDAALFR